MFKVGKITVFLVVLSYIPIVLQFTKWSIGYFWSKHNLDGSDI